MTVSTRRTFLKAGAAVSATAASLSVPHPLLAFIGAAPEPIPPIQDPRLKALVQRALDAATTAGATYADVRLTHTRERYLGVGSILDNELMAVGVRALVDGYWGFASGPLWSPEELVRLGREAVAQAKANTLGKPRSIELAPVPKIEDAHWKMPVKQDPFEIWPGELLDFRRDLQVYTERVPYYYSGAPSRNRFRFWNQRKAFGATNGTYCTQELYRADGKWPWGLKKDRRETGATVDVLTPAGVGLEMLNDRGLPEALRRASEEAIEDLMLPVKPIEVGRYDVVCDALSLSTLLSQSIGAATELDRALGYEANGGGAGVGQLAPSGALDAWIMTSGGTSYLDKPMEMLGAFQIGSPLLSVSADRTAPGGAATVQWDDEGVEAETFPLVTNGVLVDFHTMRESAGWLKDAYTREKKPFRSHGCALTLNAIDLPLVHTANLVMHSGQTSAGFDDLVAGVQNGVAVCNMFFDMDYQQINGLGAGGKAYEVRKGKRVALLGSVGILLRTQEFWKNLIAIGGAESARRYGMLQAKGEPMQVGYHSVTAVPAVFKNVSVVDRTRKA